jgi:hypothetical protein
MCDHSSRHVVAGYVWITDEGRGFFVSSMGSGGASGADAGNIPDDLRRAAMNPRSDVTLPRGEMNGSEGEPVEVVEVVTIETAGMPGEIGGLTGDSLDELTNSGGFRWWYIPAVALPVAAGATAAVLIARRNRKQTPATMFSSLAQQGRGWMDTVRTSDTTRKASTALQRGAANVRAGAQSLPAQASIWRDSAADALAGVASSDAVRKTTDRTRDAWDSVLDSVTGFWDERGIRARKAAKEQPRGFASSLGSSVSDARDRMTGAIAGLTARNSVSSPKDKATDKATDKAKQAKAAATRAKMRAALARDRALKAAQGTQPRTLLRPVMSAAANTGTRAGSAAKKTGKTVNSTWKRTRAFTFAMLVSAIVTYVRTWRMRRDEKELRETAGGRLVPADPPQQFQRA